MRGITDYVLDGGTLMQRLYWNHPATIGTLLVNTVHLAQEGMVKTLALPLMVTSYLPRT